MLNSKVLRRRTRRDFLKRYTIDGRTIIKLAEAGTQWLRANQQLVNALNVFPVPDGDTGTNMVLTMQSALDEIVDSQERSVYKVLQSIAQGALMGARGNSGVILSQLWRGFANAFEGHHILTAERLVAAFAEARDMAYKGVVRPVEGTILTVARDIATATEEALIETTDPVLILEIAVDAADVSVELTPSLLQVLEDAGVVDAGGKGLFYILEGMVRWMNDEPLDVAFSDVLPLTEMKLSDHLDYVEPGQDVEVVVDFRPHAPLDMGDLCTALEEIGTSIQVGEGDDFYRLHIHVRTENSYKPLDFVKTLGTWTNVTMENLLAQMEEMEPTAVSDLELAPIDDGQIAVITVVPGSGIAKVFASLGVGAIVEGGQTMNPSTRQIIAAFEDLQTNKVIILPNNKNIIMAAETAAEQSVKIVKVIKSCSIPQGLAAMMRLSPHGDIDEIAQEMTEALDEVETGEVTTATRDVEIDGVDVKEGEIIGLHNGKLVISASDLQTTCIDLLGKIITDDYELVTMFNGADITLNDAKNMAETIQEEFPDLEVEVQEGGQPHYQYIFSVE
jgi:DAK2 domain fusion protein YloV